MPLTEFICPDNARIRIGKCLEEGGCRMGDRCATRSYLRMAAGDRPVRWACPKCLQAIVGGTIYSPPRCCKCKVPAMPKFSTTELIGGTMLAFLKKTENYATSPDSRAFMIHGTNGHAVLEGREDNLSFLEERFDSDRDEITGIADVLEIEGGSSTLVDYKTSGSFKVSKALGFSVKKESTGEFFKSGKRKGQAKTRNVLTRDDNAVDRREWELQLNKYRMSFEARGFKVDKLKIMCVVRDGGTYIARQRGCFRNIYYFDIAIMPDSEVSGYFNVKKEALHKALKQKHCAEICSSEENWGGLRCQSYCDVAEHCRYGKYLHKERENEMIKGLSEVVRLPRLGSLRLGIKKISKGGKEYPAEIDYFKIDPVTPSELENQKITDEFHRLFGAEPKSIDIMFPVSDPAVFFPQFYKRYGSGASLKCKGDGVSASCATPEFAKGLTITGKDDLGMVAVKCLGAECIYYKKKECAKIGVLQFLIPDLPGAGVWQITTGSTHSIISINSSIAFVKSAAGRCHMIPLKLERVPQEITFEGRKTTHYILHLNHSLRLADMQRFAQIDPDKALLSLPEVAAESSDIFFRENADIETAAPGEYQEVVETKTPAAPRKATKNNTPSPVTKKVKETKSLDMATPLQISAIEKSLKRRGLQPDDYIDWISVNAKVKVKSLGEITGPQAETILCTVNED